MLKKYVATSILLLVMMITSTVSAAALRMAVLPVQEYKCWTHIGEESVTNVNKRILREVHIPLNGVLERVEMIPQDVSEGVFLNQYADLLRKNKKARPNEVLEVTADELGTDVLILPMAVSCRQEIYSGFEHENYLITDVNMELYVYRADTKEIKCYKASRHYSGSLSPLQMIPAELVTCTENVLNKAKLRALINESGCNK